MFSLTNISQNQGREYICVFWPKEELYVFRTPQLKAPLKKDKKIVNEPRSKAQEAGTQTDKNYGLENFEKLAKKLLL